MSKARSSVPKSRRRAALGALLAVTALLLGPRALINSEAQSAQPLGAESKEDTKGNYHLKASGIPDDAWPAPALEFKVESRGGESFDTLRESNIKVTLNGREMQVRPGSLRPRAGAPKRVFLMIDRSGSMVHENKLEAAKKSLKTFINSLGPKDSASLVTFAEQPDTNSAVFDIPYRESLKSAVDGITYSTSPFTRLYDAAEYALNKSGEDGIHDLIFLSDGCDQPDRASVNLCGVKGTEDFNRNKRERELKIAELARKNKIRIFTIAIGVVNGTGNSRVDFDSLRRIADEGFPGGRCQLIDLDKLNADVTNGKGTFEEVLERELSDTLREFKKEMSYSYSLELNLPDNVAHENGVLDVAVIVPDGQQQTKLAVGYDYFWPQGASRPRFGRPQYRQPEPVIMAVARPELPPADRAGIYMRMLLGFAVLVLLPPAAGLLTVGRRELRARKSITSIGLKSPWLAEQCPSERDTYGGQFTFKEGDHVIVCPECNTPHHLSCWKFGGYRCMRDGCSYEMPISPKVLAKYGLS